MTTTQRLVQQWWLAAAMLVVLCLATVVVTVPVQGSWEDRPLGPDPEAPGVVTTLEPEGATSLGYVCALADEITLEDPPEFDFVRVANVDGDLMYACWNDTPFGWDGRLMQHGGEPAQLRLAGRTGAVPGVEGRTRIGVILWALVLPLLTVAWTYVLQSRLYTSTFFRRSTTFVTVLLGGWYLYELVRSTILRDAPGVLALVVGLGAVVGSSILGRRTIGQVARSLQAAVERANDDDDSEDAPPPRRRQTRRRRRRRGRNRRNRAHDTSFAMPDPDPEPEPEPAPVSPEPHPVPVASPSGRIDVNAANFEELAALPGVGPIAARRVLDRRDERGRIDDLDELCELVRPTRRVREQLEQRVRFGRGRATPGRANPDHDDPRDPYGGREVDL